MMSIFLILCNVRYLFVTLMVYGWAVIPFVYIQSFLFRVASSAYTAVTVFMIFTGEQINIQSVSQVMNDIHIFRANTNYGKRSLNNKTAYMWNELPAVSKC